MLIFCEKCNNNQPNAFGFFENGMKKKCLLVCDCSLEQEDYYIEFSIFFRSKFAMIEKMRHLSEKPWIDLKQFIEKGRIAYEVVNK